jgi:hypothetical protein
MALTLIVVQLLLFATPRWVRPHLIDPVELRYPTYTFYADEPPNRMTASHGWELSGRTIDQDGRVLSPAGELTDLRAAELCDIPIAELEGENTKRLLDACGERLGLVDVVEVHSANRFWPLQARESALYAALAAALVGFTFWRVRRGSG